MVTSRAIIADTPLRQQAFTLESFLGSGWEFSWWQGLEVDRDVYQQGSNEKQNLDTRST